MVVIVYQNKSTILSIVKICKTSDITKPNNINVPMWWSGKLLIKASSQDQHFSIYESKVQNYGLR